MTKSTLYLLKYSGGSEYEPYEFPLCVFKDEMEARKVAKNADFQYIATLLFMAIKDWKENNLPPPPCDDAGNLPKYRVWYKKVKEYQNLETEAKKKIRQEICYTENLPEELAEDEFALTEPTASLIVEEINCYL